MSVGREMWEAYVQIVTFCNTHFIFADIIQAEIFKPKLSNSIPTPSHVFVHFRTLPMIPTFPEPLVRVPHAFLQPCLPILHLITFTLIVSNCLSSSYCIMIHDIASLAPSICSFRVLSSFFMHPWLQFHWVFKFPVSCMFLHSEYWTQLVFVLLYLTTLPISSIPIPVHSTHSAHLRTLNSEPLSLLSLHSCSELFRYTSCSGTFQKLDS